MGETKVNGLLENFRLLYAQYVTIDCQIFRYTHSFFLCRLHLGWVSTNLMVSSFILNMTFMITKPKKFWM